MRIVRSTANLALWMIPGLAIGLVISAVVNQAYELLSRCFPDLFPIYDVIGESELYRLTSARVSVLALFIILTATVYLAKRYSNHTFEFIISKTDGLFTVREGLGIYAGEFLISDAIESLVISAVFFIPASFIPKQFFSTGSIVADILLPIHSLASLLGTPLGALAFFGLLAAAHLIVLIPSLTYYRAKWLTGFTEV